MSTPVGSVTVPLSVVDPNEFTLRQPLGIGGYAGGDELQLWMDQTGTKVYLEVDDATMFVLNLADVAVAVLEAIPRIEKEEQGPQPTWPLELISDDGGARMFADLRSLAEAISEGWIDRGWIERAARDARRQFWYVRLVSEHEEDGLAMITFEPRDTASQAEALEEPAPQPTWPLECFSSAEYKLDHTMIFAELAALVDAIRHGLIEASMADWFKEPACDSDGRFWNVEIGLKGDDNGPLESISFKLCPMSDPAKPATSHGS